MMQIKILEPIGKEFSLEGAEIDFIDTRGFDDEKLIPIVKEAQALVLSNRPLSRKVIEACPHLQFISVAFTGLDHIDLEACKERSILVQNVAGYATHAVAELTLCFAIALYRDIFQKDPLSLGLELYGKRVGLIGLGTIGSEVARLFSAFGSEVCFTHHNPVKNTPYKQLSLQEVLSTCDIISLHIPLNTETHHFLNRERLSLLKKSAILINTARGGLIDQEALLEALQNNTIGGAALDVYEETPPLPKNHPKLILTPHIGYRTQEAVLKKAEGAIANLKMWLNTIGSHQK